MLDYSRVYMFRSSDLLFRGYVRKCVKLFSETQANRVKKY